MTDQLASAKTLLVDVANASEANKAEVEEGARLLVQAREAADTARRIFDAAVAARIGWIDPGVILDDKSLQRVLERHEVVEAAEQLQPAHMPYLFPEVFLRTAAGFDVILGNPPWEKIKVETDQWWGIRLPGLRSMPQKQKTAALKEFRESRPDLEAEFESECETVQALNEVIKRGPFALGSGDTDLYQAFAWRNWQLLREGGRFAIVLPRGALSGSALTEWRREVLASGSFADVCFIENTGRWAFDMEPRYTISLTVAEKSKERVVRWAGPFASEKTFLAGAEVLAEVSSDEFLSWSKTVAFPLIPDPVSAQIFRQMKRSPRFDAVRDHWEFRPIRELDASGDKKVMEFDVDEAKGRIPIDAGASFTLWSPDYGAPYAYSKKKALRPYLGAKAVGGHGRLPGDGHISARWRS